MRKVELAVDQQLLRPPLLWGEIPVTVGSGLHHGENGSKNGRQNMHVENSKPSHLGTGI
jgi:hypothetical protein